MILLAALVGVGLAGGVWLVVSGFRPGPEPPPTERRLGSTLADHLRAVDRRRMGIALAAALAAALLVRWPVAVVGAAVTAWMIPMLGQRAGRKRADARTAAIAQWCEMLRDAAGTARGIEGILVATAASAPDAIRPEVARMARRLETQPLQDALDGLADDQTQ